MLLPNEYAAVREQVAETIARSRYEAWDSHAATITWDDYKTDDPATADGIYLEDGRRDADALMPLVAELVACIDAERALEHFARAQGAVSAMIAQDEACRGCLARRGGPSHVTDLTLGDGK